MFRNNKLLKSLEEELSQTLSNLSGSNEINLMIGLSKAHRIEQAILKCKQGSYGICSICKQPIEKKRLDRYPDVAICVSCQMNMDSRLRRCHVQE